MHKTGSVKNLFIGALELVKTVTADFLTLELNHVTLAVAEVTEGAMLGEDNLITVDVYLDGVGANDIKFFAYFLRNDDSAELVDVSYYTG